MYVYFAVAQVIEKLLLNALLLTRSVPTQMSIPQLRRRMTRFVILREALLAQPGQVVRSEGGDRISVEPNSEVRVVLGPRREEEEEEEEEEDGDGDGGEDVYDVPGAFTRE